MEERLIRSPGGSQGMDAGEKEEGILISIPSVLSFQSNETRQALLL